LLFVFIILVVVLALEQRRQQQAVDAQRAGVVGAGDPLIVVTGAIGAALRKVLPNVRVDPKTGVISLPEDVLFARGSAQLSDTGREILVRAADQLAEALPCFVDSQRGNRSCPDNPYRHEIETVFIEGHTDSVPFAGRGRDNFDLSLARARAVEQAMVSNSPLSTFRNRAGQQVFSFSAYADKRPLPGTDPTDGVNRRVDLRIVLSYKPIEELIPALKAPVGAGMK
jgi:chemotaxis protein MotB